MSFSIHIQGFRADCVVPALEAAVRFSAAEGVFTMPNRNMGPILLAMDIVGLVTGGEAPPSEFGQVGRKKFESHDGHKVTPKECEAIFRGLRALMEDESDLEFLYDCLDLGPDEEGPLKQLLGEWIGLNESAAKCDGYVIA